MGAGIPGTGMATLFYLVCAVLMPLRELVLTLQGRSSWARWRLVCRHLVLAIAMGGSAVATFWFLPRAVLPPDLTIGGVSSLAVTVVLFVAYLVVANLVAVLVPRSVHLPAPKLPAAQLPAPKLPATQLPAPRLPATQLPTAGAEEPVGVDLAGVDLIDVRQEADRPAGPLATIDLTDVPADSLESAV
jgi:hypothetical protein